MMNLQKSETEVHGFGNENSTLFSFFHWVFFSLYLKELFINYVQDLDVKLQ